MRPPQFPSPTFPSVVLAHGVFLPLPQEEGFSSPLPQLNWVFTIALKQVLLFHFPLKLRLLFHRRKRGERSGQNIWQLPHVGATIDTCLGLFLTFSVSHVRGSRESQQVGTEALTLVEFTLLRKPVGLHQLNSLPCL